jgi:hypothetical protein
MAKTKRTRKARPEEKLWRQFQKSPATLTSEQVDEIEHHFHKPIEGQRRRAALAILVQSGERLIEIMNSDRETALAFAVAAVGAKQEVDWMRGLADLLETANMRLRFAICEREDMSEILIEAEAELAPPKSNGSHLQLAAGNVGGAA